MGLMVQLIYLLLKGLAILLLLQESAGSSIAPSPSEVIFGSTYPTREGTLHPVPHWMQSRRNAPSPASQPSVPPLKLAPAPVSTENGSPLSSQVTPILPPISSSASPRNVHSVVKSLSPRTSHRKTPHIKGPKLAPEYPVPVVTPLWKSPQNSPTTQPVSSGFVPSISPQIKAPDSRSPISVTITPVPIASPPHKLLINPTPIQPTLRAPSNSPVPSASLPRNLSIYAAPLHPLMPDVPPSNLPVPDVSLIPTPPPSFNLKGDGTPVATPLSATPKQVSPLDSPTKAPVQLFPKGVANAPRPLLKIKSPPHAELHPHIPAPSRDKITIPAPFLSPVHPPASTDEEPDVSPISTRPPSFEWKGDEMPVAAPSKGIPEQLSRTDHSSSDAPMESFQRDSAGVRNPLPVIKSPPHAGLHSPIPLPSTSLYKHPHATKNDTSPVPSSYLVHSTASTDKEHGVSPISSPSPGFDQKKDTIAVAVPSNGTPKQPQGHFHVKASMLDSPSDSANAPTLSVMKFPPHNWFQQYTPLPSTPHYKHGHTKEKISSSAVSSFVSPSESTNEVIISPPSYPPKVYPNSRHKSHAPPILHPVAPSNSPLPSMESPLSPVSPTRVSPSQQMTIPLFPPRNTPSGYSTPTNPEVPHLPHIQALPPPPPNEDCPSLSCREPFTNNPSGSPCGCVLAMQVGLRLGLPLYTFFTLVSDLAAEISRGVRMKQSQVRIMGANADSENQEKTVVLLDLVPFGAKFDNYTAYLIYQKFWHKQMPIEPYYFGNYEVLYLRYPGLPASPPAPSTFDGEAYSGQGNKGRPLKPLGVDVSRRQHKKGLKGGVIAIIVLLASVSLILCFAVAWVLLFRHRNSDSQTKQTPTTKLPSLAKSAGFAASKIRSGLSSVSPSYNSGFATNSGTAKTFSAIDIERATDSFDASRKIGEGGFGIVYSGVLDDETKVAVKVLKRDNQQGGREFLSEVEMLSRLHHRNLVKLMGICMEEHARCLVYELIPNGSVESHLHGVDKEEFPLDWNSRLKIALGAARGLAYLHEDSSPRVIHRDFKSSNILLEHDFTPKVSDFGLARTASDEENKHVSTRVMGTFGYVAPEYAMTGHLLVKSDVYSYGVVLLELLTGRKPVDMSRAPGQENLVTWARPLLSSKEGLELVTDQSLRPDFPFESIAKVAAIASMCVQPEVSDRPFMSEVVQALKLICSELYTTNNFESRIYNPENVSFDFDARSSTCSGHMPYHLQMQSPVSDVEWGLRASEVFSASARFERMDLWSFRRHSSPGPVGSRRVMPLLQRIRGWSGGSTSEHRATFGLRSRSQ